MKVEQAMTKEVASCFPEDSLRDAATLMAAEDRGALVVLEADASRHVLGVVTDRDVCLALAREDDAAGLPVRAVMSAPPICCRPDDALWELLALAETHGVRRFPVIDRGGQLLGLVSLDDVAREAARSHPGIQALSAHEVCRTLALCAASPHRAQELALPRPR